MPDWVQWVTFALGTLGAVLGFFATWGGIVRDRPMLRVRAVWYSEVIVVDEGVIPVTSRADSAPERYPDGQFGIEVVNPGQVPVFIREIGVTSARHVWWYRFREFPEPPDRGTIVEDARGKVVLPYELVPGASVVVVAGKDAHRAPALATACSVFAITQADQLFLGRSRLLQRLSLKARN
jgi:hypothetical protein